MKKIASLPRSIGFFLTLLLLTISILPSGVFAAGTVTFNPINFSADSATISGTVAGVANTSVVVLSYSFADAPNWTNRGVLTFTGNNFTGAIPGLVVGTSYEYGLWVGDPTTGMIGDIQTFTFTAKSTGQYVPTGVTAVAGAGSAIVTFLPSPQDPVGTTYYAFSAPDALRGNGPSPVTVSGLTNGKSYTFQVRSVYNGTESAPSTPSNAVIPTAVAGNSAMNAPFQIPNPIGGSGSADLLAFFNSLLDALVLILTPVLVLMVIYSGFLFVTAQGNSEKLTEAKTMLLYTLVGAAIVLGAHNLATILGNTLTGLTS